MMSDWVLGQNGLEKTFDFSSFKEAIGFVVMVSAVAERANHHLEILINYTSVKLTLFTHSAKAVTEKDHTLAKEIDQLFLT